jgi:hypothetical protein
MSSPDAFETIEADFRRKLLGGYSTGFSFDCYGRNLVVSASDSKPAYFKGSFDITGRPLYVVLSGLLCGARPNLADSAIGYRLNTKQRVEVTASGKVNYTYLDDTFRITSSTNVLDGLPTDASLSTHICKGVATGASVSFDPSRSGLKNYTFVATATRVKELWNSAVLIKLDATEGYGLGVAYPVNGTWTATGLLGRREFKVGARMASPCGASVGVFADLFGRSLGFSATKGNGEGWNVNLSAAVNASAPTQPVFGVSFSGE